MGHHPYYMVDFMSKPIAIRRLTALSLLTLLSACGNQSATKDPEQLIPLARAEMQAFRFNEARKLLKKVENPFPETDPRHAELLYLRALSYWQSLPPVPADVEASVPLFMRAAELAPEANFAAACLLYVGRIYDLRDYQDDPPRWEEAREAYQKVVDNFPDSQEAAEARIRISMTHLKQIQDADKMAQGRDELVSWLDQHEEDAMAPVVATFLAGLYDFHYTEPKQALKYYQIADKLGFVNQTRAGNYLWRMHELALEEKQIENAAEYCRRIVEDFSRSGRGYEAWLVLKQLAKDHPRLELDVPEFQDFENRSSDSSDAGDAK